MDSIAKLTIVSGDGKSQTVPLGKTALTLGRSPSCDLSYPSDAGLSRQHLVFEPEGSDWVVRDPGSKNGSKVNSQALTGKRVLQPGDQISAGQLLIRFGSGTGSPAAQTVYFVPETQNSVSGALAVQLKDASSSLKSSKAVQALIRAGRELSSHRPLTELFELVLGLAREAVGATRAVLLTADGDNLTIRAAEGSSFKISSAVRDRVLKERESILVQDTLDDALLAGRQSIVLQGIRSIMAVPLQVNDRVTGLIYLDTQDILHPFTEEDLSLLTVLANVAAIRIEHVRLAEVEEAERFAAQELANAADIQRGFLPSSAPSIAGFDIAGQMLPCRGVGGDYFDYFVHPDGTLSLVVADVSGKGMAAALMMSNMQAHTQAMMEMDLPPHIALKRLNRVIAARCPGNRFITCFLARINPVTGELVYANAGHNAPVLARAGGKVESLDGGGIVLGILPSADYDEYKVTMRAGDVLSLFTDGATEACPSGRDEEFGEERFGQMVARHCGESSGAMVEKMLAELTCWTSPAHFADDVTLVVAPHHLNAEIHNG
jgi:Serine phosphatase RsbU, regulator of sigma subunit